MKLSELLKTVKHTQRIQVFEKERNSKDKRRIVGMLNNKLCNHVIFNYIGKREVLEVEVSSYELNVTIEKG